MNKNLTSVEVIGLAVRSEQDAYEFYDLVARVVKNPLVKSKFEELAKEEARHKAMLLLLYRKMTKAQIEPIIPGSPNTAEKAFPVSISNLEDALNLAITREQEAQQFYKNAAANSADYTAKRILEYLVNIEKGHELMLKSELEAYLRDRDFYANNPELMLVG